MVYFSLDIHKKQQNIFKKLILITNKTILMIFFLSPFDSLDLCNVL